MTSRIIMSTLEAVTPADLLNITAESLAETGCSCRDLPTGSTWCNACREAERLASLTGLIELPDDVMNQIIIAGQNAGTDLGDLLPAITEGILDQGVCTCREGAEPCPICSAARGIDDLWRDLQAA